MQELVRADTLDQDEGGGTKKSPHTEVKGKQERVRDSVFTLSFLANEGDCTLS